MIAVHLNHAHALSPSCFLLPAAASISSLRHMLLPEAMPPVRPITCGARVASDGTSAPPVGTAQRAQLSASLVC